MKSTKVLCYGLLIAPLSAVVESVLNSVIQHDPQIIAWTLLTMFVVCLVCLPSIAKVITPDSEWQLVAINIMLVVFALMGSLLPLSEYWLAKDTGPLSIALGLPCLVAIIYWNKVRIRS